MWIFGYGSLIFRPSFPFVSAERAFIPGWERRFWQGSPDHRGTPAAPGRVVTLIEVPGAWCGGRAYQVDPDHERDVLAALDAREQAGFERTSVRLSRNPGDEPFAQGLTYLAPPGNPHYLGPLPEVEIARRVARSSGPSGHNRDYVLALHEAILDLGLEDTHVAEIVRHLLTTAAI